MPPNAPKTASGTVRMDDEAEVQSSLPKPPDPFSAGEVVGDYRIRSILGTGSFATVYLAEEQSLGRLVALKVVPTDAVEGRTIAQLSHEGIVRVHSQSTLRGWGLINMQFVPSVTLETLAKDLQLARRWVPPCFWLEYLETKLDEGSAPLSLAEFRNREKLLSLSHAQGVAWLGIQAAEALAHAHSKGILHLDIKPSNLLIHRSGRPFLMDFNVSVTATSLQEGVPDSFGGTFDFMAPEQKLVFFSGDRQEAIKQVGEHSDVCSLGLVLKRLLPPLPTGDRQADELHSILDRATEKEVRHRYKTAKDLAAALTGFLEISAIRAELPGRQSPLIRWVSQHPLLGLTLLGAIPQVFAALVGTFYNQCQIISRLLPAQQIAFERLQFQYSAGTGILSALLWTWVMLRLKAALRANTLADAGSSRLKRQLLLWVPWWGALTSALSWLPGAAIFPTVLHLQGGLSPQTAGHLVLSYLLSFAIALAYSFVVHSYFSLCALYPRLWTGEPSIAPRAQGELKRIQRALMQFCIATVLIPLVSVLYLLYQGVEPTDGHRFMSFRVLLGLLCVPGSLGVWFSVASTEKIRQLVDRFTQRSH